MNNILAKVRKDSNEAILKLKKYRQSGDHRNYKSLIDSLQILISMNNKNVKTNQITYFYNDVTYINESYYDSETMNYYNQFISLLKDEIELLSRELDTALEDDDIRMYRDMLISFDKLNELYNRMLHDYKKSKSTIEKLNLSQEVNT